MDVVKNQKQLINEHCQREKLPNPTYVCTPDQEKNPNGFFCTLSVGGQSFCTSNWQKTKKNAELEAAKLACKKMDLTQTNAEMKAMNKKIVTKNVARSNGIVTNASATPQTGKGKPDHPVGKEPDWITIEKVEDIYKYLTDEVLAQEFKAFLHCKAQEEKKGYPVFTATEVKDKGFTAIVTYDGNLYNSLGVMMSKKQAEQSASEVCLRALGDFPSVPKDKYTIQVYKGGQVHQQIKKKDGGSKYLSTLLQLIVGNLGLQFPQYRFKETVAGGNTTYKGVCWFEGKVFESGPPTETTGEAKQHSAAEALKFLGFADPQEASELKEHLRIKKRRAFVPLGVLMSPLIFCPSKRLGWIFYHFEPLDQLTGEAVTAQEAEGVIDIRKTEGQTGDQVLAKVFGKPPAIEGKQLSARSDLSVGEVDGENKNIVMVGNDQCSIRMFCTNGKIRCTNRSCDVELLPGHNIRGLKCSYQIMLPSLQVYLTAESCDDLFYPNPPLPVITSCGMAMLIYDHEANAQDLHILLTRPSNNKTFVSKAKSLASYLNKLISGSQSRFNVVDCIANINTWTHNEVKLVSEMTMDSMHELMSPYVRYDDRWNEIFAKEHPDVLKELKDACVAEISRRDEEGSTEEEVDNEPWVLPNARFRHRLLPTGILIENNLMCTFRGVLESTGLKVKIADMEASPTVDMPIEENTSPHRGDMCRYYVWKGLRKVSEGEVEPYYKGADILGTLGDDWVVDAEMEKKNAKKRLGKEKARQKRKAQDGNEGEGKKSAPGEENGDEPETTETMDEDKKTDIVVPAPRDPAVQKDSKAIHEECRWFPLEEAKEICPLLTKISTTLQFQSQVKALQIEANTFMKDKANGSA